MECAGLLTHSDLVSFAEIPILDPVYFRLNDAFLRLFPSEDVHIVNKNAALRL
jgi:hypothetical protein